MGELSQLSQWIENRARKVEMCIAISKYGVGGDPIQHKEGCICKADVLSSRKKGLLMYMKRIGEL